MCRPTMFGLLGKTLQMWGVEWIIDKERDNLSKGTTSRKEHEGARVDSYQKERIKGKCEREENLNEKSRESWR